MLDFPTFASTFAYTQVSTGWPASQRVLELMNRENNLDQNEVGTSQDVRGADRVPWGWNLPTRDKDPVLHDIRFTVEPGQTVAIVGQTGSGKTSLVKLINRTYDATQRAGAGGWRECA